MSFGAPAQQPWSQFVQQAVPPQNALASILAQQQTSNAASLMGKRRQQTASTGQKTKPIPIGQLPTANPASSVQQPPVLPGSDPNVPSVSAAFGPGIQGAELQRQAAMQQASTAQNQLAAALAAPAPVAPTYTPPTLAQPDKWRSVADAVAAALMPHQAAGIMSGMAAGQAQRQADYDRKTKEAQDTYGAQKDAYTGATSQQTHRDDLLGKLSVAADSALTHADTNVANQTNQEINADIKEQTLSEKRINDAQRANLGWANVGARNRAITATIQHYADALHLGRDRLTHTITYEAQSLAQRKDIAALGRENAMKIATMKAMVDGVLQKDRDWQAQHRELVNSANSLRTSLTQLIGNLDAHGQNATADQMLQRFAGIMNGPAGTQFQSLLSQGGASSSFADDALAAEAEAMGVPMAAGTDPTTGAPTAGTNGVTINFGGAPGANGSNGAPDITGSINDILKKAGLAGTTDDKKPKKKPDDTPPPVDDQKAVDQHIQKLISQGSSPQQAMNHMSQFVRSHVKDPRQQAYQLQLLRRAMQDPKYLPPRTMGVMGPRVTQPQTLPQAGIYPGLL